MEYLTPELERRLQVEELWARRIVLADSMNARRRDSFRAQRSLLSRFGTDGQRTPLPNATEAAAPPALRQAVPVLDRVTPKTRSPISGWTVASILAAAMLMLLANGPLQVAVDFARAQFEARMAPSTPAVSVPVTRPAVTATIHAAAPHGAQDLRAEVAAQIAASMGSHAPSPEMLRALQSGQNAAASR